MEIRFYNTLSRRVEAFEPINPPDVYVYNCGPTVYDYAHIGNFRTFVFGDVLRRSLELAGFNVHQVMNLTDVGHMTEDQLADGGGEDKMQVASRRFKEAKKQGTLPPEAAEVNDLDDPYQIAQFYIDAFVEDADTLGLKIAGEYPEHTPRATDYIPQMQDMIRRLIANDHAYVAEDGAVYYAVESFPDYGRLSGNTIDQLRAGAGGRVLGRHQSQKRHPSDFLLWKPDETHVMKWDSPWGAGYPNWHLECSTMATTLHHRDVIDIHTGAEDNIFPHHECEIAQTRGATGHAHFARYWMHARHLLVEREKMSKSKGNFFTLRDLLDKGSDPAAIRYELLRSHYRSNLNFTFKGLDDSAHAVRRLRRAAADFAAEANGEHVEVDLSHPVVARFAGCLADDLNVSGALGEVFGWLGHVDDPPAQALAVLRKVDTVLNVLDLAGQESAPVDVDIENLCRQIDQARAAKDYARSDALRQQLIDAGYEVRTAAVGTVADR